MNNSPLNDLFIKLIWAVEHQETYPENSHTDNFITLELSILQTLSSASLSDAIETLQSLIMHDKNTQDSHYSKIYNHLLVCIFNTINTSELNEEIDDSLILKLKALIDGSKRPSQYLLLISELCEQQIRYKKLHNDFNILLETHEIQNKQVNDPQEGALPSFSFSVFEPQANDEQYVEPFALSNVPSNRSDSPITYTESVSSSDDVPEELPPSLGLDYEIASGFASVLNIKDNLASHKTSKFTPHFQRANHSPKGTKKHKQKANLKPDDSNEFDLYLDIMSNKPQQNNSRISQVSKYIIESVLRALFLILTLLKNILINVKSVFVRTKEKVDKRRNIAKYIEAAKLHNEGQISPGPRSSKRLKHLIRQPSQNGHNIEHQSSFIFKVIDSISLLFKTGYMIGMSPIVLTVFTLEKISFGLDTLREQVKKYPRAFKALISIEENYQILEYATYTLLNLHTYKFGFTILSAFVAARYTGSKLGTSNKYSKEQIENDNFLITLYTTCYAIPTLILYTRFAYLDYKYTGQVLKGKPICYYQLEFINLYKHRLPNETMHIPLAINFKEDSPVISFECNPYSLVHSGNSVGIIRDTVKAHKRELLKQQKKHG